MAQVKHKGYYKVRVPIFLLLSFTAVSVLYPVVYVAMTSARSLQDYLAAPYGIPSKWTFENFQTLIDNYGLDTASKNTIMVVCTALIISITLSSLAGYALAKIDVPGRKFFTGMMVGVMLLPAQVMIIPIYLVLSKLDLVGHLHGLVFLYAATNIPFGVFYMRATFLALPDGMLDAARIDGAGFLRTFRSIALPNGLAGLTTLAVLQFLGMWNELLYAFLLLPDQNDRLLTPALANIGGHYVSNQPLVAAALCITAAPPLILLALTSRYLTRGVMAGFANG